MTPDSVFGISICVIATVLSLAAVKGCAIVNNPETIRADTDQRIRLRLSEEYAKHPNCQPSKAP